MHAETHFMRQHDTIEIEKVDFNNCPKFQGEVVTKARKFRKMLDAQNDNYMTINAVLTWKQKYNIDIAAPHWLVVRLCSKEERVRLLHWKILHMTYPTNIILHKMGLRENNLCQDCKVVDFVEHFFFHCRKISKIWLYVENYIHAKIGIQLKLIEKDVLLGYKVENVKQAKVRFINHVIMIAKMCIGNFRYGKALDIQCIFEREVQIHHTMVSEPTDITPTFITPTHVRSLPKLFIFSLEKRRL